MDATAVATSSQESVLLTQVQPEAQPRSPTPAEPAVAATTAAAGAAASSMAASAATSVTEAASAPQEAAACAAASMVAEEPAADIADTDAEVVVSSLASVTTRASTAVGVEAQANDEGASDDAVGHSLEQVLRDSAPASESEETAKPASDGGGQRADDGSPLLSTATPLLVAATAGDKATHQGDVSRPTEGDPRPATSVGVHAEAASQAVISSRSLPLRGQAQHRLSCALSCCLEMLRNSSHCTRQVFEGGTSEALAVVVEQVRPRRRSSCSGCARSQRRARRARRCSSCWRSSMGVSLSRTAARRWAETCTCPWCCSASWLRIPEPATIAPRAPLPVWRRSSCASHRTAAPTRRGHVCTAW